MREDYLNYILDALSVCGNITSKRMFGGYGIYKNGTIFGLIVDNELYFKVGESNISQYKDLHSEQLTFETKGKTIAMPYWKLPEEIIEQEDVLGEWVAQAVQASIKHKKKGCSGAQLRRG